MRSHDLSFNQDPNPIDIKRDIDSFLGMRSGSHFLPHSLRFLNSIDPSRSIIFIIRKADPYYQEILKNCCKNHGLRTPDFVIDPQYPPPQSIRPAIHSECCGLLIFTGNSEKDRRSIEWMLDSFVSLDYHAILVPLIFLWNREPSRINTEPLLKRFRSARNLIISTGAGLDLRTFITALAATREPNLRLKRVLLSQIHREEKVITGNARESYQRLFKHVTIDSELQLKLQSIAQSAGKHPVDMEKEVHRYLREIASDYTDFVPRLLGKIIHPVFTRMFSSITFDVVGLDQLRHLIREKRSIILIPSHRSHLDYLILSFGCYHNGMVCPLVAAGHNLSFWPMGWIFRHCGGFFLRRTFKGLDLYPFVFKAYFKLLIRKKHYMKFYIEGGRSRTGLLLSPKLGLLGMVIDAVRSGDVPDVDIVPIAINYDRIPEEDSYIRELSGIKKKKERFLDMIRSYPLLQRKYGDIHVSIGNPISVKKNLDQSSGFSEVKEKLGLLVMNRIREKMPVTPTSIFAAAIFAHPLNIIPLKSIHKASAVLFELLSQKPLVFSDKLKNPEQLRGAIEHAQQFLIQSGILTCDDNGMVTVQKRLILDYLKNSIIGHLFPYSIGAITLLAGQDIPFATMLSEIFCPWYLPIPEESLEVEFQSAFPALMFYSEQDLFIFSGLLLPLLSLISEIRVRTDRESHSADQIKGILQSLLPQYSAFPELTHGAMLALIEKITLKKKMISPVQRHPDITATSQPLWQMIHDSCGFVFHRWQMLHRT